LSRKRIFTVHVNIDDMTAMIAGLDGVAEKAEWLDGYIVGVHGHPSRETWSCAKHCGYSFGSLHAAEADAYRLEQSQRGVTSAEKRFAKNGTAQPNRTNLEPPLEPPLEPTSNQSNNPTIQQSIKPTIEKTSKRFVPPTLDELTAYAKEAGMPDPQRWMDHYTSNGWKVGKSKMVDWKACVRNWARSANQQEPQTQTQKPDWVLRKIEDAKARLATAERQLRRDIADKGVDSHSARLSRKQIESIQQEINSL
jgi:hypothetical protein